MPTGPPLQPYQILSKYLQRYQSYWAYKDASMYVTQQQKLSRKRIITQLNFCGWLPISNLTCISQWYTLMRTSDKINAPLQNLLNGNHYFNPTIKTTSKKGQNRAKIWRTISNRERTNLSAFRTFVRFAFVWFCLFPLLLGVYEGLWLVIVALPGIFSSLFWSVFPNYINSADF